MARVWLGVGQAHAGASVRCPGLTSRGGLTSISFVVRGVYVCVGSATIPPFPGHVRGTSADLWAMRTLLSVVAALALVLSLGSPAQASVDPQTSESVSHADRRCATIKEFRRVKEGMTISRVRRVLGTSGRQTFAPRNPGTARYSTREYRTCSRPKRGALSVDFYNGRVMDKFALWTRSKRDTARCVTNREYRRVHRGMRPRRVHRIFDTAGGFVDGFAGGYARGYNRCRGRHVAVVYVSRAPRFKVRLFSKRFTFIPHR